MRGALLAGAAGLAQGMPSFRERLPNAYGVECPGDHWEGCTSTGLCMGLGHTQCAGGGALGAFGVSFLQHGYEWTTDMCEDDADGDGQSNGRELGDPCCLWEPRATLPAAYEALMASWHKTHPGDPAHTSRSDVADALCDAYGPDDVVRDYPGFFTPNETARAVNYSYELTVANYEIPAWRTIYADFIWDVRLRRVCFSPRVLLPKPSSAGAAGAHGPLRGRELVLSRGIGGHHRRVEARAPLHPQRLQGALGRRAGRLQPRHGARGRLRRRLPLAVRRLGAGQEPVLRAAEDGVAGHERPDGLLHAGALWPL